MVIDASELGIEAVIYAILAVLVSVPLVGLLIAAVASRLGGRRFGFGSTQVLDTLARTGRPSRAEVSDASMAERAECVMLNKGPYITNAIATLDSILTRMHGHQDKRRSLLRQLNAWKPVEVLPPEARETALSAAAQEHG